MSLIFVPKKNVEFSLTGLGARMLNETSPYLSFISFDSLWAIGVEPSMEDGSDWYLFGGPILPSSIFKEVGLCFLKEELAASLCLSRVSSVLSGPYLLLVWDSLRMTSNRSLLMFWDCSREVLSKLWSPILSEILLWMNLFWNRSEVPPAWPPGLTLSIFDIFDYWLLAVYLLGVLAASEG